MKEDTWHQVILGARAMQLDIDDTDALPTMVPVSTKYVIYRSSFVNPSSGCDKTVLYMWQQSWAILSMYAP